MAEVVGNISNRGHLHHGVTGEKSYGLQASFALSLEYIIEE